METSKQKILALKYRPKNFKELIGQNIMVETITNSIKLNKLPNAYLLTGIRGVGKTTTARLIAQAINCKKNFIKNEQCNEKEYCSCKEIRDSKMLDCLEIDAASKTGIDSIRELIDSSQYAPTSTKFKVIILDEVQQLSKAAFSGLLKTLEEPPQHLKFIFCTTEAKKIPVTIISRCQTFHLHRVSIKDLFDHLKKISKLENGKISEEALKLISKAAEGSVRDSLSLLDRALISQDIDEKEIGEKFIRKMLGIADRSKTLNLLNLIFQAEQKKSIEYLREMINEGIQPINFLNELLEIIYFIQQNKILGDFDSELSVSEVERDIISSISKDIDVKTLIVFWQFIVKVVEELSVVSNPILSIEMLVVRLVHLKEMPDYEDLIISLKSKNVDEVNLDNNEMIDIKSKKKYTNEENPITKISKDQIKNTIQTKPFLSSQSQKNLTTDEEKIKVSSFEDLIYLASKKREIQLKYDLEKNVNLIKFSEGKIDISFNQNLDRNFVRNLSTKLVEWTGNRWVITLSKEMGKKTFFETQNIQRKEMLDKEQEGEVYKDIKNIFSDAELLEVKKRIKL
jgi:DNA polymerase-3 subunit gamma/tau